MNKDISRFPQPGRSLPGVMLLTTTGFNAIPEMVDPLGKHWDQPAEIRTVQMNDNYVWLTRRQLAVLPEYNSSYPSGAYEGKCWARFNGGETFMCWYYDTPELKEKGKIAIGYREVILLD